ncbi:MAG: zinc ABC transporter substrate-binding protein [Clostridiales bacterium]|jgi:zinc transport system substrate-binding protein|nr:zinc ABC transporter substrate-binding protein [Clostridiales bacterium]
MLKKWTVSILCLSLILSFSACGSAETGDKEEEKLKVSVTFNALKEFTEAVGGDKVQISTIVPDGVEPHDFEPKARDLTALSQAQLFVYNGLGMEAWVDKAIASADAENLITVDVSTGITPIKNNDEKDIEEHGQYDPHIWLSLKDAETAVTNIKDALSKADPGNKEYYELNCSGYISKLESLYSEYSEKFGALEKKSFVTGHAAFAYLCRDFGLEQKSVEDVFAEGEPGARTLTELVEYCKSNDITTVFAEEMASPEVSETLARAAGAELETIYTIESAEDGKTYLERMEENLKKIYSSLSE